MQIHPNRRTLRRFAGNLPRAREQRVLRHLLGCGRCRDEMRLVLTWDRKRPDGEEIPWSPQAYGALLDRLVAHSAETGNPLGRQQVEAPVLLAELLLHPGKRRKLLLRNSARFRSWPLAELLLDRSREEAFEDPAQAESLARLGLEVVEHLAAEHKPTLVADLRARGLGYLANALRMRSDLVGAAEGFSEAESALEHGSGDPLEKARLMELRASLERDRQSFDDALALLDRAAASYRRVGEELRARRAELKRAVVTRDSGDPEAAIQALQAVLADLPPDWEPRLYLCTRHNLAVWLTDLDRHMEARQAFREAEPWYDRFPDPWTQRRRAWVEGRILHGLGQLEAAEAALVRAQRGFLDQEIAYDAALVSLDLAAVYAEQGRTDDLKRLASGMVPIFRARDIHREALAALSYFRRAVEMETATASLVHQLLDYLHRARHNPALSFEHPEDG